MDVRRLPKRFVAMGSFKVPILDFQILSVLFPTADVLENPPLIEEQSN